MCLIKIRLGNLFNTKTSFFVFWFSLIFGCTSIQAQKAGSIISDSATIDDCLKYAMQNQPLVRQLKLDEAINNQDIKIALSEWLPQVSSSAGFQHYLKQPEIIFPDFSNPTGPKKVVPSGVLYNSVLSLSATQNLFNNDVYIARKTAGVVRQHSAETTRSVLTDLVVSIQKAFYDVQLSVQQLGIVNEEIDRLTKSRQDAYSLYQNGITDMIDYKRASISLNNAIAQKRTAEEAIKAKVSYLKQLLGYPEDKPLKLNSDISSLKQNILLDTLQNLNITNRIEYQLLQTNLRLQKSQIDYYRLSFLPSLSAYANYNIVYQNDIYNKLYKHSFPNSTIGVSLSFPIFEGTKRNQNIKKSTLQYDRLALDTLNTRNEMNTEYVAAMSSYKSDLAAYLATEQNTGIAQDIYNTVKLQYNQGVKTYLEVITSETDLMSARINNLNALFMLMFSKLDVQRALGKVPLDY